MVSVRGLYLRVHSDSFKWAYPPKLILFISITITDSCVGILQNITAKKRTLQRTFLQYHPTKPVKLAFNYLQYNIKVMLTFFIMNTL